jgi:hypothetical protein
MTESEWWACQEPQKMLDLLRDAGRLSQRKARLFAVAVCRRAWPVLTDERSRRAVEVAERHADGLADDEELAGARQAALVACIRRTGGTSIVLLRDARTAAEVAITEREDAAGYAAHAVCRWIVQAVAGDPQTGPASHLRDIFFNPLRATPTIPEGVLAWNDGCIVQLATGIYEDRDFSQERMGVLADALEEAGVSDAKVLAHVRSPTQHCRGCWVVDLVLGKE